MQLNKKKVKPESGEVEYPFPIKRQMTSMELEKLARKSKCKKVRSTGSHIVYEAPDGYVFTIPRHANNAATGTSISIQKDIAVHGTKPSKKGK